MRVARAILGLPAPRPPYFWSDQLELKLQLVGRTHRADTVEIEDSTPWPRFVARYLRGSRLLGLFAVGAGAAIGQARHELERSTPDTPRGRTQALHLTREISGVSPRAEVYHSFSYPKIVDISRHGAVVSRPRALPRVPTRTTPTAEKP